MAEPAAQSLDVIDPAAWDAAGFSGTALGVDPTGENPPFLGCLFQDEAKARALFQGLQKRLGVADEKGMLRVAIVEGPAPDGTPGYVVHLRGVTSGASKAKLHRVTPPAGSTNLAEFKEQVKKHGTYLLIPIFGPKGSLASGIELMLRKTKIHLRTAAEVRAGGESDPDARALAI